ncbi:hypothetical protein VTK73DRAFT_4228 [Phialemonium thermophilum]|uniref:Zn(2)-C6 fungal-type domain-containing protein n=1 Tax=Phialemonium thermophilum TaxID=223376 RepID=A0ABR3WVJ3_9PEZI
MGRRPNSLILQYFERGPKLTDNSNRYPHTCKACGENFPKGRIDSLTNHLTKKCPAISEADRINACLTLHGIGHASRGQKSEQPDQSNGTAVDHALNQRDWTALETLAEVSRQFEASEKHDDRPQGNAGGSSVSASGPVGGGPVQTNDSDVFELQEQFTVDHPALSVERRQSKDKNDPKTAAASSSDKDILGTESLSDLIQSTPESANITMAAAAAARLNPSLLDPQLLSDESSAPTSGLSEPNTAKDANTAPQHGNPAQPWGEITYMTDTFQVARNGNALGSNIPSLAKGTFQLHTANGLNGAKTRHSRARFNSIRRKEVQEVRKIGACIRCRILRKTCSKGHPCDTCRKVLSPRVWRSGCVRTKFTEELDLYSASVQIVLAQHRINSLKLSFALSNRETVIEACHFPDRPFRLFAEVLEREDPPPSSTAGVDQDRSQATFSIVMIDNDTQDVPGRVEVYMREVLPEFVQREPSHFMRVTLETALRLVAESKDELLRKSLELWGLVEILDRERQWSIRIRSRKSHADEVPDAEAGDSVIKEDTNEDVFTTICLQLTAAAERKAAATSKSLLTGMQRVLQDSKTKVGYSMYFATLILLNCVEKSTWAFKAWEQDNLRPLWPLEKEPGSFTQQGYIIADLLRMLLQIRKALPRTARSEADGRLVTLEQDPLIHDYFEALNLNYGIVQSKQEQPLFSPTDPRSFELLFCSTLLLPGKD